MPRFTLLLLALALLAPARVVRADDDDDDERALARRAFDENCQMCHAAELVASQRLTPAQWRTEVDKMVGWGSPLPKDDVARLAAYLAREYPATKPAPSPERLPASKALALDPPPDPSPVSGDPALGATLFAKNCANCHGPAARGGDLGTNLVENPILLRPAEFRTLLRTGLRRMPGLQAAVNPSQEADILAWLRTLRTRPAPAR